MLTPIGDKVNWPVTRVLFGAGKKSIFFVVQIESMKYSHGSAESKCESKFSQD